MTRKFWIWAVAGAIALPQIGMAQFGPKPGQQQPKPQPHPAPAVKPAPQPGKPQPAPAVKPAPKPQPAPVVKPAPQPPAKPQPPHVVKPAPQPPPKPQPAVVVKPEPPKPPVEYRPGHKDHPLRPPKERDHYKDWAPLRHKQFYRAGEAPTMMQVSMRVGQEVEFKLEEKVGDGLKWFARHDPMIVDVDVEHERPRWYQFGGKTHSEVEIEGRRPGNTIVELVYARQDEWDCGIDPQKVIQIFVHIE